MDCYNTIVAMQYLPAVGMMTTNCSVFNSFLIKCSDTDSVEASGTRYGVNKVEHWICCKAATSVCPRNNENVIIY